MAAAAAAGVGRILTVGREQALELGRSRARTRRPRPPADGRAAAAARDVARLGRLVRMDATIAHTDGESARQLERLLTADGEDTADPGRGGSVTQLLGRRPLAELEVRVGVDHARGKSGGGWVTAIPAGRSPTPARSTRPPPDRRPPRASAPPTRG